MRSSNHNSISGSGGVGLGRSALKPLWLKARRCFVFLALATLPLAAQGSGTAQYFYDDVGRLTRVVTPSGTIATYNYDAVGNLLSITRSTLPGNNGLAILNFTPQTGSVGQTVAIQGQGFGATPSLNAVQFNGVAATVSAATASTLTVTVPSGATTGPISVTVNGQSATSATNFVVTAGTLVAIIISPAGSSLYQGATQQFVANGLLSNGTQQNLTSAVNWGSSIPSVATISNTVGSSGLATGVGFGTTLITAISGSIIGSTTLKVASLSFLTTAPSPASVAIGLTQQFSATGSYTDGTVQNLTSSVTWSSSNTTVVTINSSGLATPLALGSSTICAVLPGSSSCSFLTVTPALVSIAITPSNEAIPKGITQQFIAIGTFSDHSTQNITDSVSWKTSSSAVAVFGSSSSPGLVTDIGAGTAVITASSGAISGSTTFTLTAPVAASLNVSPADFALPLGGAEQLAAQLVFSDNTTQNVTQTATWSSSATNVATVSNSAGSQGLVTGVAVGTATIMATSNSISGSSTLVVNSTSGTTFPRFLYVSNGGGSIFGYSVNAQTGQLRANGSVQVSNQSGHLALDPSQSYLYCSVPGAAGNFFVFSVNPVNGTLTQVSGSPYKAGTSSGPVVTEPSDRFVYVGDAGSNSIFGFSIGAGGALTALPGSPYPATGEPTALLVNPSGKFLFELTPTTNVGGADPPGSVSVFTIDSNSGALTPISGSPFDVGNSPVALAQDPAGKYLYVSNSGQSNTSRMRRPKSHHDLDAALGRSYAHPERENLLGIADHADSHIVGSSVAAGATSPLLLASLDMNAFPETTTDRGILALARSPFVRTFFQLGGSSSASVTAFTVDPNAGTLTAISGSPFLVSSNLTSISVDTTGQYLYGPTFNSMFAFSINAGNGALTPLSNSPFSLSVGPLVFDPSGLFAYAQGGSGLQEMGTNSSTGTLTALSGGSPIGGQSIVITAGSTPISYVPQFAYVVNIGSAQGNIAGYSIDPASGALTSLSGSPFAEGYFPVSAAIDVSGQSLYVANTCSDPSCAASNGSVSGYSINPGSGALTAAAGSPFPAGPSPVSIALQPPGVNASSSSEYAYVASQNGQFFEYSVNPATGVLTTFSGSPANTAANGLIATAVDPTGATLYVVSPCSGCTNDVLYGYDLFLFQGQLIYQPPIITASLGTAPRAIGVDPGGRYVLVTDGGSNTVSVFSTTSYTQVAGSPFATDGNPSAVALDPYGQFVYIANQATNDVSAYAMNPSTGLLTPIPGSPYSVGTGPVSLSVDFSGEFLYVTNNGAGTVSAFSIIPGTGALTPVPGSPFPAGAAPISVVTTGGIQ
jgi:YD repeat-containing protein